MDLNLVRVFVAVYETRGITAAAQRLYVTPPAVSQSLTRLRRELDDPLFARRGNAMHPTPVADDLYGPWRQALMEVDRSVDAARNFDPSGSHRTVRIGLTELGEVGWLPSIVAALGRAAPGLKVTVLPVHPETLSEWLSNGTVDLAVSPTVLPSAFGGTVVKSQPYMAIAAARHPLAKSELTLERYASADHLQVAGDPGHEELDRAHLSVDVRIDPKVVVHRVAAAPSTLVANPGLMAVVPESIARGWAKTWPLTVWNLPVDVEPVGVRLFRRRTSQHSAFLDWLHDLVLRTLIGSEGTFEAISGGA